MNVIFYRRVSTKEQANSKLGLDAQLEQLKAFAAQNGLTCLLDVVETSSGGGWIDARPELRKALELCSKTKSTLLVAKLDRLSRRVCDIANLMQSSINFCTVEDGLNASPMLLHMKSIVGEHELTLTRKRTRDALQQKIKNNQILGFVLHKSSESIVKARANSIASRQCAARENNKRHFEIVSKLLHQGMTQSEISQHLNSVGYKTSTGKEWSQSALSRLIAKIKG